MTQETKGPSWWQTLPGSITAIAALITAVTGLVVAIHQAGWLARPQPGTVAEAIEPRPDRETGAISGGLTPLPASGVSPSILMPSMGQVRVANASYSILEARLEPQSPQASAVVIALRMTNEHPYGLNFWDRSFRLLVDGVPRAPVSNLNKVVEGHSAEEGEIRFVISPSSKTLVLQIREQEETALIALE